MRVLADENIPGLERALAGVGELRRCAGRQISAADLDGIDVLLVRSVTRVDRQLLGRSSVSFVGSCTTGVDHVDVDWLRRAGIRFAYAPGANARSVVEYVFSALCWLALYRGLDVPRCSVGIVGLGQIGSRLYRLLSAVGLRCIGYDPFLDPAAGRRGRMRLAPTLDPVLAADIVTLHTPLTRSGAHPTWHLLDAQRLGRLRPGAVMINSSRGAVVDNAALSARLARESAAARQLQVVLDVWEAEPAIDRYLLERVVLATPHIAGYSYDGKLAGVRSVLQQLFADRGFELPALEQRSAGADPQHLACPPTPPIEEGAEAPALDARWASLGRLMLSIYDIGEDDRRMRTALGTGADPVQAFEALRRDYPIRRESSFYPEHDGGRNRVDRLQRGR